MQIQLQIIKHNNRKKRKSKIRKCYKRKKTKLKKKIRKRRNKKYIGL